MPDESPLSLDGAMKLMFTQADSAASAAPAASAAAEAAPVGANAAVDGADAPEEEENTGASAPEAASAEGAEAGEQDTPADQGETTEGQADQGDNALPPIEPPKSWTTEEKALWASLNRPAQEAILRRDQADTKALRDLQNRQAEQSRAAETEVNRLKGLAAQVESVVNKEVGELARDFPEIKSESDVVALAANDPARYSLFQAKLMALQSAANARAAAAQEVTKASEKAQTELLTRAKDALIEAFPTWKEPEVARRESSELQDYVVKSYGVDEATARNTIDPVIYKLAHKAMLYDRAQAQKAAAIKRDPPRVVQPGAQSASPKGAAKEATRRSQLEKLGRTGAIEDALSLMFE